MKRRICILIMMFAWVMSTHADIVYQCDFEDASTYTLTLNSVREDWQANMKNLWYVGPIGHAGQSNGKGLYISSDGGKTYTYNNENDNFVVSYLTIPDLTDGQYCLEFDWRAVGNGEKDGLYVIYLPQGTSTNSNPSKSGLPDFLTTNAGKFFTGQHTGCWKNEQLNFTVNSTNRRGKVVLLWYNDKSRVEPCGACVDNVVIRRLPDACAGGVTTGPFYNDNTFTLSWTGDAASYDIRYYNEPTDTWTEVKGVSGDNYKLKNPGEGLSTYFVRAVCVDGGVSAWSQLTKFSFVRGLRCLDYWDIGIHTAANNRNAGICFKGLHDVFLTGGRGGFPGIDGSGASDDMNTTHAVHIDRNEIDPHTHINGGLKTVPNGEIASVRVGAANSQGNSAMVEYQMNIQPGQNDVLVLKYAVVLCSGGHPENVQPRFMVNILDDSGKQLLSSCSRIDFKCGFGDLTGWNLENGIGDASDPENYQQIYWKDWDTIRISLRDLAKMTRTSKLTIRFSSIRCAFDTHFAKAYFAFSCESGSLDPIPCGQDSLDQFVAPEGFRYQWMKDNDHSKVLSRDQVFHIEPSDTNTYVVNCMNVRDTTCYFQLEANPNPRYPEALLHIEEAQRDCQNIVQFTDSSAVYIFNKLNHNRMEADSTMFVDSVIVNFGDGSPDTILPAGAVFYHEYPAEGGEYHVHCTAIMSGESSCQSEEKDFTVSLPDINQSEVKPNTELCLEDTYYTKDDNRPITYLDAKPVGEGDEEVYLYMDTLRSQLNRYGCPAEEVYPVYFHKDYKVYRMDTICEGEYYQFGGRVLAETGTYENKLTSRNGCDSIEYLSLYVVDAVRTRYTPQYVCLDDGAMDILLDIAYEAPDNHYLGTLVRPDSLSRAAGFDEQYQFGADEPISIPLPEALKQTPGTYYWTFSPLSEKECMAHTDTLAIQFLLPHSAIEWRYGYIAVTNPDYNGGYSPVMYQWYCDGNMLPGETASTILMDWTRDADHLYHCVMTDETGRVMMSCPIIYASTEEPEHDAQVLGVMNVWAGTEIQGVYDILGRYVGSEVPTTKGIYIICLSNGAPAAKILVP